MDTEFQTHNTDTEPLNKSPMVSASAQDTNKKVLFAVLLTGIVMILIGGLLYYFLVFDKNSDDNTNQLQLNQQQGVDDDGNSNQNQSGANNQDTPANSQNEWERYYNKEFGFGFNHPSDTEVFEYRNPVSDKVNFSIRRGENDSIGQIIVSPGERMEAYLDREPVAMPNVRLAGVSAQLFILPNGYCDGGGCTHPLYAVMAYYQGRNYIVEFNATSKLSEEQYDILNSVTFDEAPSYGNIPPDFSNEVFDVSFHFPSDWEIDEQRSIETETLLEVVFDTSLASESRESVYIEKNGPDYRDWILELDPAIILSREQVQVGLYRGEKVTTSEFAQKHIVLNRGDDFVKISGSKIFDNVVLETIDLQPTPEGWSLYHNKDKGVHFFYPEDWQTQSADVTLFGVVLTSPDYQNQITIRQLTVPEYGSLKDGAAKVLTLTIEGKEYDVYNSADIPESEFIIVTVEDTDKVYSIVFDGGYQDAYSQLVSSFMQ